MITATGHTHAANLLRGIHIMGKQEEAESEVYSDEQLEEAAFLAEFNNTEAPPPVAASVETEVTQTEEEQPAPAPAYTYEQIKALEDQVKSLGTLKDDFAKRYDSMGGKFGGLQQKLDQVIATNAGKPAETFWTEKQKSWLKNEFPEMYSGLFDGEEDNRPPKENRVVDNFVPVAPPEIDVEDLVSQRVAAESARLTAEQQTKMDEMNKRLELKSLAMIHGDIGKIVNGQYSLNDPESYSQWLSKLDNDTQKKISESWDSDFLSEKLSEFKAHMKEKAKKTSKQEMAVVTRGTSRPAVSSSDLDEEEIAFRKEFYGR